MTFAVCCLLCDDRCVVFVVRCMLFVVWCLSFVVLRCLFFVAHRAMFGLGVWVRVLFVVRCALCFARYSLLIV